MVYENVLHFSTQTVAELSLHLLLFNIKHMRLYVALHNRQLCVYCRYKQNCSRFSVSFPMLALGHIIKAKSPVSIKHLLQGFFSLDLWQQPPCSYSVVYISCWLSPLFCVPCCMRLNQEVQRYKEGATWGFTQMFQMFKSRKIMTLY